MATVEIAPVDSGPMACGAELSQPRLALAGQVANDYAAAAVFLDYTSRKALNTLRAQQSDLATFAQFLVEAGAVNANFDPASLQEQPAVWRGVTWGLVDAYVKWMLNQGYAIGTVNRKLSTVKVYAKLATKAGAIDPAELAMIRNVGGYSRREGKRVDRRRDQTRVSSKKPDHITLTPEQAAQLKAQPDTPQGRRDALMMCLLLDHGLRVGEVAGLKTADVDLARATIRFFRPKVDKEQTHRLSAATQRALTRWLNHGEAPAGGPLLRGSLKSGELSTPGMTTRAITARVKVLGEQIGIVGLSAHDCRHYWATQAARNGTDAFVLRDAGGWNSLAMPGRYVEDSSVANEGVKLGEAREVESKRD
ncbi:MAG: tyrosine-type recombinase/integrase [Caldilineaceae bacterium]|nr:tyrosine-type recombinase/integrase [Caldilineaceae bacterium]